MSLHEWFSSVRLFSIFLLLRCTRKAIRNADSALVISGTSEESIKGALMVLHREGFMKKMLKDHAQLIVVTPGDKNFQDRFKLQRYQTQNANLSLSFVDMKIIARPFKATLTSRTWPMGQGCIKICLDVDHLGIVIGTVLGS